MIKTKRQLNPRVCRGCGLIFMPLTGLQRYGLPACKEIPPTLKIGGRWYGCYRSTAIPGGIVTHPESVPPKEQG